MAAARVHSIQTAFISGELSPEIDGRTDVERVYRGCKTVENYTLRPLGGVRRRAGTRHVAPAKDAANPCRLVDFVPSDTRAYVLEFSGGFIRFFKDNGQIQAPVNLVTNGTFPFPPGDLAGWTLAASGTGITPNWDGSFGGCAHVRTVGGGVGQASIRQDVTVTAGVLHQLSVRIHNVFGEGGYLRVGSTSGGSDLVNTPITVPTSIAVPVTSPTTTISITLVAIDTGGPQESLFVDDVILSVMSPLQIASPYLAADLDGLSWAPSNDVLYLACDGYAPRKLLRTSDTAWTLQTVTFRPPPTEEKDLSLAATLTLSATTGNGITVEASAGVFLAGDVDREITSGVGRLVITSVTDADTVVADVLDTFSGVSLASGTWVMKGSPSATLTPNKKEPKGAQVTLTSSVASFRAADVGKYVRLQNGIVKVTKFTSSSSVAGSLLVKLEATTGTTNWTLESESWDATDGFPTAVGFSAGDRLVWVRGQRTWASVVGGYEEMGETTLDDAALSFRLNTDRVCAARWVVGATDLVIGTSLAEFIVTGGADTPLAPLAIFQRSDTTFGSTSARPARAGAAILFVEKSGRSLYELGQDNLSPGDRYVAADLLQLAGHLTPVGQTITAMAYQSKPDQVLWCVRSDGALLGLTYNRPEQVIGWHRHRIADGAGIVESVAVIPHPNGDRDQVWLAIRYTVAGATIRYIEYLDDTSVFSAPDRVGTITAGGEMLEQDGAAVSYGQAGLDSCLVYNGPAITLVTGLAHLNGASVVAIGDGKVIGSFTVASGQITLPVAASTIEVGRGFVATLVPMRPELQVQGTSQGVQKGHGEITLRLYRTSTLRAHGQAIDFRTPEDDIDDPIPLFTGDKAMGNLGWDADGFIAIQATEPLPCEILMITSVLGVGV